MKIIRSFLLITVCICTANFIQAQELKAEVRKVTAIQPPPAQTATNKPSPAPELKPMNDITPTATPSSSAKANTPKAQDVKSNTPAIVPKAAAIQDVPADPNNAIPAPGTLKKHIQ